MTDRFRRLFIEDFDIWLWDFPEKRYRPKRKQFRLNNEDRGFYLSIAKDALRDSIVMVAGDYSGIIPIYYVRRLRKIDVAFGISFFNENGNKRSLIICSTVMSRFSTINSIRKELASFAIRHLFNSSPLLLKSREVNPKLAIWKDNVAILFSNSQYPFIRTAALAGAIEGAKEIVRILDDPSLMMEDMAIETMSSL